MLICTTTRQCDAHRDGFAASERCPGYCDSPGCTEPCVDEVASEVSLCRRHAAAWHACPCGEGDNPLHALLDGHAR